jgi:hypothetical protein
MGRRKIFETTEGTDYVDVRVRLSVPDAERFETICRVTETTRSECFRHWIRSGYAAIGSRFDGILNVQTEIEGTGPAEILPILPLPVGIYDGRSAGQITRKVERSLPPEQGDAGTGGPEADLLDV